MKLSKQQYNGIENPRKKNKQQQQNGTKKSKDAFIFIFFGKTQKVTKKGEEGNPQTSRKDQ